MDENSKVQIEFFKSLAFPSLTNDELCRRNLASQKSTSSNCISWLEKEKQMNESIPDVSYSVAVTSRGSAGELFDRLIDKSNKCERNDDVSSSSSSIIIFFPIKFKRFTI